MKKMQEICVEILFSALNLCKIFVVDGTFADFLIFWTSLQIAGASKKRSRDSQG